MKAANVRVYQERSRLLEGGGGAQYHRSHMLRTEKRVQNQKAHFLVLKRRFKNHEKKENKFLGHLKNLVLN